MVSIIFGMLTDEQQNIVEKIFIENDTYFRKIAFGILKSEADVHDAVSTSYIKIMQHIERISQLSCPQMTAFCVSIVKHTAIDIIRNSKKATFEPDESKAEKPSAYNLEDEVTLKEKKENLLNTIKGLSREEQLILQMRYMDEMKYSAIAEIMNISEEAVKKKCQRIILKLRKIYEKEVGDEI